MSHHPSSPELVSELLSKVLLGVQEQVEDGVDLCLVQVVASSCHQGVGAHLPHVTVLVVADGCAGTCRDGTGNVKLTVQETGDRSPQKLG